jgi:putative MATE family efflux protein
MGGSGISEETLALGVQYLNIQLYGFIPLCLSFTVTAVLRGIGDTKTPMVYNTLANVINLIFNYIMIYGKFGCPEMGVAGAAWATVIGQTVAFFIAVGVVISKKRYIYLDFKEKFKFDMVLMNNVISIGVPSMIEQLFMRAGIIIYARTVAGLGDTMYATHQVCMSIQSMSFMMGNAFANAATTLMGQSLGKRRYDMAELYMRQTRNLGIICSFFLILVLVTCNKAIIALYNDTPEVIAMGSKILLLLAASQPFQADQFITAGGLRGAGDTRYTAFVIAITVLGVRSGLGVLAIKVFDWGLWGAWIALIADQLLRTGLMGLRYKSGKWKTIATNRFKGMDAKA